MNTQNNLSKLTVYIEENLRAARGKGIEFVDPRRLKDRVVTRQNHVIFGRRGAGKTTLLTSIEETSAFITIYMNLEDAKDAPLPDTLIRILMTACRELDAKIKKDNSFFSMKAANLRKKLRKTEAELNYLLDEEGKAQIGETEKNMTLQRNFEKYKQLFREIPDYLEGKAVYLTLDDFYFVPREQQADLVDYLHRLTKDTDLYLKVGTVKDRSDLYRAEEKTYRGVEIGHDAHAIDIDYTMEKFAEMEDFLHELLETANRESGANIQLNAYFKDEGFQELCRASEGVPREFLSLFVKIASKHRLDPAENPVIGKEEILAETQFEVRPSGNDASEGGEKRTGFFGSLYRGFKKAVSSFRRKLR